MVVLSFGAHQKNVRVKVNDALGQVVAQSRAKRSDRMINEPPPPVAGPYLLTAENDAGERVVVQVVVL